MQSNGISFLIARRCQCLTSWDMEDSEDCPGLLQADPNVLPGISWPHRGLFMIISHPPLVSHFPSCSVNFFKTAQVSVESVNGQGSAVITSLAALSLARWRLPQLLCERLSLEELSTQLQGAIALCRCVGVLPRSRAGTKIPAGSAVSFCCV